MIVINSRRCFPPFFFVLQQPLLTPQAACVARQAAVFAYHAVAGYCDAQLVSPVGQPYHPPRLFVAHAPRLLAVADGGAEGYFAQLAPRSLLKSGARLLHGKVKRRALALKVLAQLACALRRQGLRIVRRRTGRISLHKGNGGNGMIVGGNFYGPKWRPIVGKLLHNQEFIEKTLQI